MKKLVIILSVAVLGIVNTVQANPLVSLNNNELPGEIRNEVLKNLNYPTLAKEQMIEGEVWIKVALDKNAEVKVVDLSSTNPELVELVREQLTSISTDQKRFKKESTYFMKVKFNLIN